MSWPAYAEYVDSGVDRLGLLPRTWQAVSLQRLFRIVGGATPKSDVAAFWDGDITWVTPADLGKTNSLSVYESGRTITSAGIDACAAEQLPAGSIVLSVRAPIGTVGIAEVPMATNQGCKGLVGESIDSKFVAYQLSVSQSALEAVGRGTTFTELSATDLGAFKVAVPPIQEQTAVAGFLDRETAKIDALIAKQEQLIATLREDRAATITQAVTKGLDPNTEMKDSGVAWLGDVPAHWTPGRLKHVVASISSGTSVNAADVPAGPDEIGVLKTSCVSAGWFNPEANKTVTSDEMPRVSCPIVEETLLVNRANTPALVGSAGYVKETRPNLYLSDKLWQVMFEDAAAEFVYYWTGTAVYRSQIAANCVGASSSMQNLSMTDFQNTAIALPPVEEQKSIVEFLNTRCTKIDALITRSIEVIATLREYRSALITDAVTGKIDVRGVA
ncbi:restriction endonuclease subunit S [Rhodococcus hoagii]|nr:restriction endonuclease subunit S [Prescottella equi]